MVKYSDCRSSENFPHSKRQPLQRRHSTPLCLWCISNCQICCLEQAPTLFFYANSEPSACGLTWPDLNPLEYRCQPLIVFRIHFRGRNGTYYREIVTEPSLFFLLLYLILHPILTPTSIEHAVDLIPHDHSVCLPILLERYLIPR